jgi:hypothetical protein
VLGSVMSGNVQQCQSYTKKCAFINEMSECHVVPHLYLSFTRVFLPVLIP